MFLAEFCHQQSQEQRQKARTARTARTTATRTNLTTPPPSPIFSFPNLSRTMPKQSSIDGFFGAKRQKQSTLDFFAKKPKKQTTTTSTTTKVTKTKASSNTQSRDRVVQPKSKAENDGASTADARPTKKEEEEKTSDQSEEQPTRALQPQTAKTCKKRKTDEELVDEKSTKAKAQRKAEPASSSSKKPRRQSAIVKRSGHGLVLDDDDDDDDDDEMGEEKESKESDADFEPMDKDDNDNDDDANVDAADDDDDDPFMENATAEKEQADEKPKRSVNNALKHNKNTKLVSVTSKKSSAVKKSDVVAKNMKDDETLRKSINWSGSLPYLVLSEAMERIEDLSGRLEIQEQLTDLFRQVIAEHPEDMYFVIYLVSNSVAPAYECVELGIGDAILIKAVGAAYGTNPGEEDNGRQLLAVLSCFRVVPFLWVNGQWWL